MLANPGKFLLSDRTNNKQCAYGGRAEGGQRRQRVRTKRGVRIDIATMLRRGGTGFASM